MNRTRAILLLLCCAALPACETLLGTPEPTIKTTHVNPDGSTTVTETVIPDPQRAAHAQATLNLFAE